MHRIEHTLRELLVRDTLAKHARDQPLGQTGCTKPYAGLDAVVLVRKLRPQSRFPDTQLRMWHSLLLHDDHELRGGGDLWC